eukprot:scpid95541/ scgid2205/ 
MMSSSVVAVGGSGWQWVAVGGSGAAAVVVTTTEVAILFLHGYWTVSQTGKTPGWKQKHRYCTGEWCKTGYVKRSGYDLEEVYMKVTVNKQKKSMKKYVSFAQIRVHRYYQRSNVWKHETYMQAVARMADWCMVEETSNGRLVYG